MMLELMPYVIANEVGPGLSFTYPRVTLEPENLKGYRISLTYQPESFIWSYVKVYLDSSYGRWYDDTFSGDTPTNSSTTIYSIAPVVRTYYKNNTGVTPFLDVSVGFAYSTKTKIYIRNLGMHFTFQDQLAIGASLGKNQHLSISLGGLHYSNGALCKKNSGMTIPLFVNVGYRF